jgi:hypothetical protein
MPVPKSLPARPRRAPARTPDSLRSAIGAVQGVRVAVQELGLRVPRVMESIIAHNAALAGALQLTELKRVRAFTN